MNSKVGFMFLFAGSEKNFFNPLRNTILHSRSVFQLPEHLQARCKTSSSDNIRARNIQSTYQWWSDFTLCSWAPWHLCTCVETWGWGADSWVYDGHTWHKVWTCRRVQPQDQEYQQEECGEIHVFHINIWAPINSVSQPGDIRWNKE